VREVLDLYATLPGQPAAPHRIEHIETSPDRTVARFAPQRVTASMQPVHMRWVAHDMSDPWSKRLDHERCRHAWRSGDIAATGALVVLGSDWPVAPYDPRMGFFAARERRAHDVADPRPVGASQPLTGLQTLAGYTSNAAAAVGASHTRGRVAPGFTADLVMWQDDPVAVSTADIVELPILLTVARGRVVHRASP
jgi:predicted amidohydrolase YtcJ